MLLRGALACVSLWAASSLALAAPNAAEDESVSAKGTPLPVARPVSLTKVERRAPGKIRTSGGADADESLPPKRQMPRSLTDRVLVEGEPTDFQKAFSDALAADNFFSDERFEDEVNYTRLRLRLNTHYRDGDGFDFDPETRFRFALPTAERRFVLLLSGDVDGAINGDDDDDPDEQEDVKGFLEPQEEEDAVVALQTFLKATEFLNISVQTGLRFRDFSPVGFIGPRYRQTFDLDPWALRVTQQVRWFSDEGFAARSVIDLERRFGEDYFLRLTPRANWSEEDAEYEYGLNARLFHFLGPKSLLQYQVKAQFETEPVHTLDRIVARVRYRRKIMKLWENWLFIEVAPELRFRREDNYEPAPGILIRFDSVFEVTW